MEPSKTMVICKHVNSVLMLPQYDHDQNTQVHYKWGPRSNFFLKS